MTTRKIASFPRNIKKKIDTMFNHEISYRAIAKEITNMGYPVSHMTIHRYTVGYYGVKPKKPKQRLHITLEQKAKQKLTDMIVVDRLVDRHISLGKRINNVVNAWLKRHTTDRIQIIKKIKNKIDRHRRECGKDDRRYRFEDAHKEVHLIEKDIIEKLRKIQQEIDDISFPPNFLVHLVKPDQKMTLEEWANTTTETIEQLRIETKKRKLAVSINEIINVILLDFNKQD